MSDSTNLKLLFIINPGSGNNKKDWTELIRDYFKDRHNSIDLFNLPDSCNPENIKQEIDKCKPDKVVVVGGDGTVKLVGQCLIHSNIAMGILPGGSANGLAKELEIPEDSNKALDIIMNGAVKEIHLTKINDQICIHLSDIGFNAFVIKKFESEGTRGMWGYIKASWKVLWRHPLMHVEIKTDREMIKRDAAMIVVANATRYGTGAKINPDGKLDDKLFEVIVVKKISLKEIFKMMVTHSPYDPAKTEVFQSDSVTIVSEKRVHFQVDGEYLGKVNNIKADIIPHALKVIIPATTSS